MIFSMIADGVWDIDRIARHLGVGRLDMLDFIDTIMAKAAGLYLPSGFTISITVRAGRGVRLEGEHIPNHINGGRFPS